MKIIYYLLSTLILLSCNEERQPNRPKNLIPEDKMAEIMYDVYIMNAAKGINKKLLEVKGVDPDLYIYKKHGIDSLQFAQSNEYYAYDIDNYQKIIDTIKYRIDHNKKLFQEKRDKENLLKRDRRDSLNSIIKKRKDSIVKRNITPRKMIDSLKVEDN